MGCFYPQTAYRSKNGPNPKTGKWPITFTLADAYVDMPVVIPCGKCIGCRLERSRLWAIRCMHEASLYRNNCFITLTYDDQYLPFVIDKDTGEVLPTLQKEDFVNFMKSLRKRYGAGIRFFHCGEYGEVCEHCGLSRVRCVCKEFVPVLGRPHHHALIFNHDFDDKYLWQIKRGVRLYRSPSLERLWPYGHSTVGDVTFESAAYVARYVMKKITGDKAEDHYRGRQPEYVTMSRRPGIAREWIERYKDDVYPDDYVLIRKKIKCKPPRYYDYVYDLLDHENFVKIKSRRIKLAARINKDKSPTRLRVLEACQLLRAAKLIRTLD